MTRVFSSNSFATPAMEGLEIVERKGIGHPDTLADLVAEEFSRDYSRYCLETFGVIANHAVDKVLLSGALARVEFGSCEILAPVRAFLVGKVTERVGSRRIPIGDVFRCAVERVLRTCVSADLAAHLDVLIQNNVSFTTDHRHPAYRPDGVSGLNRFHREARVSSDTVACFGFAGPTRTEALVVALESWLASPHVRAAFPEIGTDIKVMAVRTGHRLSLTLCVPFVAGRVSSPARYTERKEALGEALRAWTLEQGCGFEVTLALNTKDIPGLTGYLTATGSALDKGDQGAVGRGNHFCGYIPSMRNLSSEAPYGKNPVYHSGKLYTLTAFRIAESLRARHGTDFKTAIVAQNGQALDSPSLVSVACGDPAVTAREVADVVDACLSDVPSLVRFFLDVEPSLRHTDWRSYLGWMPRLRE